MTNASNRYLAMIAVTAALVMLALWYYPRREAMAFMESGYAVWQAKETLIEHCDLGSDVYFGDLQADSAIIPRRLSASSTNIALAGGSPIESYFWLQRVLTCPALPKRAVLSFGPSAFEDVELPWLWESGVRYGVFDRHELREVNAAAERLGDPSYAQAETRDGNRGLLRDLIYGLHLPSIYFSALLEGRLFMRRSQNLERFNQVLNTRGYPNYGQGANANGMPAAPINKSFEALPLQVYYLDAMIDELGKRNIRVDFLITPIERGRGSGSAAIDQYQAFLNDVQAHHPSLHLLQSDIPLWESNMFVDGLHLTNAAAEKFTTLLDRCLTSALPANAECRFLPDKN